MRIAELHLERYGRFEDHRLVFAKRDTDFHLVFGPNEAGKTTSLAALADLLFGFEHAVGYDFRFAASLLRVGAVLEQGAERLACRRRRGRQGTLVDDEDRPIDEARLTTMLSGQRRDAFLLSSSLDHARLRRGGQAMAESKDDLGQMLFAAGSGLIGLRTVLKNLDEDLEAIWGPRRSEKRSYTRAERALAEARTALREATLKPMEWGKARNDRDRLRAEHIAAEAARRRAASALAEVERLRRVYGAITRRAAFLATLATETAVLLPEPVEAAARQALQTAANEEQKRDAAQSLHAGLLERLEAEPADEAALALTERIEALVQKLGAEIDRREQRPRREEELQIRRAAAEAAAGRLGLVIGDDLSIALPTEADVARLRELVSRRAQLTARAESARDVVQRTEAEVVRADRALAAAIIPEGLDELRSALDAARRAGNLDARVDEERAAVAMGKSRLVDAIAALAPWTGDATALERLAPPTDAVIDTAKTELEKARSNAADARRTAAERNSELELARARLERLSAGGEAVSTERLYLARSERDAALLSIRRHVEGIEALADPMGSIRRLEAAVQAADEVADVRFVAADASARLSQAEAEVAELTLRCEQAARRVEVAAEDAADRASAWADRLAAVNLPIAAPEDLRAWLARRGRALEARERLAEAEGDFRAAWEARARTVAGLAAALGEPVPAADAAVAEAFARAEARLAKLEEQARAIADSKRASKEAHERDDAARRDADRAQRDLDDWRSNWDAALADVGLVLAPEAAETRLVVFEALRAELEQARALRRRIDGMKADGLTFALEAAAVAQALGIDSNGKSPLDLVRDARARLGQAEVSQARRKTLQDDAAARRADAEAAQAALDAAEVALADARHLTATSDRVALAAALDGSRRRREVEAAAAILEQEIRIDSDGHPLAELEAACAPETPETLAERAAECARNADELAQRAQEAGERAAESQLRFDQLDSGASAADAAADAEQARSEMEALAEIYLLKCAEHVLLDYAMRRQAERRRNPMLLRAAALFKTLTLGRYSDLRADYDSEKPRLIGLCADGATTVAVSDMSEGTQDQLFLALRLAAVEQGLEAGVRLPFIADDLFVTFDDDRARAGLEVLGELSRTTQVLFFTHHTHLRALAQDVFGSHALSTSDLSDAL